MQPSFRMLPFICPPPLPALPFHLPPSFFHLPPFIFPLPLSGQGSDFRSQTSELRLQTSGLSFQRWTHRLQGSNFRTRSAPVCNDIFLFFHMLKITSVSACFPAIWVMISSSCIFKCGAMSRGLLGCLQLIASTSGDPSLEPYCETPASHTHAHTFTRRSHIPLRTPRTYMHYASLRTPRAYIHYASTWSSLSTHWPISQNSKNLHALRLHLKFTIHALTHMQNKYHIHSHRHCNKIYKSVNIMWWTLCEQK